MSAVTVDYTQLNIADDGADFASEIIAQVQATQSDLQDRPLTNGTEELSAPSVVITNAYYSAYSTSTSSISYDGTYTYVDWTNEKRSDSIYSKSTTEITVGADGDYLISFDGSVDMGTDSDLFELAFRLEVDDGGGYDEIVGSVAPMTRRGTYGNVGSSTCSGIIVTLAEDDVVRLGVAEISRGGSGESANLVANANRILIKKI